MIAYIRDLAYKAYVCFIDSLGKRWRKVVSCNFAIAGMIVTASEVEHILLGSDKIATLCQSYAPQLLIGIIVYSIYHSRQQLRISCFVGDSDTRITLRIGNLWGCYSPIARLSRSAAIVVPTNTTFDTTTHNEFISIRSVQGQYQKRFFKNSIEKLDQMLHESLSIQGNKPITLAQRPNSKNQRYSVGTTAQVNTNDLRAYFLAIADVNECGQTENASIDTLRSALVCFWDYMARSGHEEPLAMPIIGSGRAGIRDASMHQILKEIVFSFITSNQEKHITKDLTIYIHPNDLKTRNIKWASIVDDLEITCRYHGIRSHTSEGHRIGTPIDIPQ